MSLFDNPKGSDYFKFNGRLYYLEQMFKNFLKGNNVIEEEEIREVIDKTTFRQSIIDQAIMNNPIGCLY
jgi:hypothetical protein